MFSKFPWTFGRAKPPVEQPAEQPAAESSQLKRRLREIRYAGVTVVVPDEHGDAAWPVITAIVAVRRANKLPPDVLSQVVAQCMNRPIGRCRGGRCGR